MIEVTDIRQTRVYQEASEEGSEKTRQAIALRLLARDFPVNEVADLTGLTVAQVKKLKKKPGSQG